MARKGSARYPVQGFYCLVGDHGMLGFAPTELLDLFPERDRLIRLAYGPFQLGNLDRGQVDEIKGKVLKEQLGQGKRK